MTKRMHTFAKCAARGSLSLALTLGLMPALPAMAVAAEDANSSPSANGTGETSYPATFDLRNCDLNGDGVSENYVTSVKLQNPWGSCWAFAATAAAEISIIAEQGLDASSVDLSEHHLAWFANSHLPAEGEAGYDASNSQSGEGVYTTDTKKNMDGGTFSVAVNAYASGIGAVNESIDSSFEYHGTNKNITDENGDPWTESSSTKPWYYSADDDWSIDEQYRYYQSYQLEESVILSSLLDPFEGTLDQSSVNAVKEQLSKGRGVAATFYADTALPEESAAEDTAQYINTKTWAHYTYDDGLTANHGVCIVGWDDNYSASNFLTKVNVLDEDGNVVLNEDGTPKTKTVSQPAGDGAWIVKNSWGASSNEFPNNNKWGVDGSGYFYLSYYDKSLTDMQAYDFYTDDYWTNSDSYYIEQYDTAPATEVVATVLGGNPVLANVFEAETSSMLRSVSCLTTLPDTQVEYAVYLVDDTTKANPTSGTKVASGSLTYSTAGFHHIDLADPAYLAKGQSYAVVEKLCLDYGGETMGYVSMPIATNETADSTHYTKMVVNKGESLVQLTDTDGTTNWSDWTEMVATFRTNGTLPETKDADNIPIKAYLESALDVTFDANGGTGSMDALHTYTGQEITLPECTFTAPEGYEFAGWKCGDTTYNAGDKLTINENTTVVAQWSETASAISNYAGSTRYDTSRQIIKAALEKGSYKGVIIASGASPYDALSASGLSGLLNYPVLLSDKDELNSATTAALFNLQTASGAKGLDIIVVGGTAAISADVERLLDGFDSDGAVTRLYGQTRYETNMAIYNYGKDNGSWSTDTAVVATGENYPDALAIASYASSDKAPVILTGATITSDALSAIGTCKNAIVLGGTSAVSAENFDKVKAAVSQTTTRLSGATRYDTSLAIVNWELTQGMTLDGVGFATGANFPDALASGFLLGTTMSCLMLVSPNAADNTAALDLLAKNASSITSASFFGGDSAISDEVRASIMNVLTIK